MGFSVGEIASCDQASRPTTSVRRVANELKCRMRRPDAARKRALEWTVDCGTLSDEKLIEVLAVLRRSGYQASFERDFGTFVHFKSSW